ncbi:MAG: helix-turn-helix domain-containing protein [Solirubrobacteraceae bacterium]|nr:helix-turn-helix domain-containing protein [Patulibacter sp.]
MGSKTEPKDRGTARACPIADALDLLGDRWSLLVLREINLGHGRFSEIRVNTGAPKETLTARLRKLEEAGVIARRPLGKSAPNRHGYVLTDAGEDVRPVLAALHAWGEHHGA